MSQDEAIRQWLNGAAKSLRAAQVLHADGNEELALFHRHLTVEKTLKALYVLEKDAAPPLTHDLTTIASALADPRLQEMFEDFKMMSKFAVATRYDDVEILEDEIHAPRVNHWIDFSNSLLTYAKQKNK